MEPTADKAALTPEQASVILKADLRNMVDRVGPAVAEHHRIRESRWGRAPRMPIGFAISFAGDKSNTPPPAAGRPRVVVL